MEFCSCEWRQECISKVHANLVFQANKGNPSVYWNATLPVLSLDGLKVCTFISRSDLVLDADHSLDFSHKTFRCLWRFYSLLVHGFFVVFSWPSSLGVSETGSAKTGSAIDVRIDDAESILKFRIGFFP